MGFEFVTEGVGETVERQISDEDIKSGMNMLCALLAKGKSGDEAQMALVIALAIATVVFAPDDEALKSNRENDRMILDSQIDHLWSTGAAPKLMVQVEGRVNRLLPMKALFDIMVGKTAPAGAGR